MQIPMVVRERRVRVYASIPVSEADALKALAAASGVPVARAVHYAVERLLDVARREGALAVTGGLAPASLPESVGDSVAEVAEALDLRFPEAHPGSREPVPPNGERVHVSVVVPERDRAAEPPAEQPVAPVGGQPGDQDAVQERASADDRESDRASGLEPGVPAASGAAPGADPPAAPPG
ncbi:MAG: hypothetical protein OXG72_12915 [Acidobacteria bacterium]|nr:hypothetical protein [Acidobacteriota bacterium]